MNENQCFYSQILYDFFVKYEYSFTERVSKMVKSENILKRKAALPSTGRNRLTWHCNMWMSVYRGKWKESTRARYETIISNHILPALGAYVPSAITTGKIAAFTNRLLEEKGLSPKTVKDILMVLHGILRFSAKTSETAFPVVEFIYPKERKKEVRVLSLDEQKHFVSYLSSEMDFCKLGVLLALSTGIRIGELCALRWNRVSISEKIIRITNTIQRLKNPERDGPRTKILIGAPKSDQSFRIIPLTEHMAALCASLEPDRQDAFLLTGSNRFMEPRTLQYRLKKYAVDCGLAGLHFHTLRHTFATRCMEAGVEIKSLSEILGHANTSITLECYIHSSMEIKRKNINKLSVFGL